MAETRQVPGRQTERLGEAAAAAGAYVVMGVIERSLARVNSLNADGRR